MRVFGSDFGLHGQPLLGFEQISDTIWPILKSYLLCKVGNLIYIFTSQMYSTLATVLRTD
jgi:hypothetical protein